MRYELKDLASQLPSCLSDFEKGYACGLIFTSDVYVSDEPTFYSALQYELHLSEVISQDDGIKKIKQECANQIEYWKNDTLDPFADDNVDPLMLGYLLCTTHQGQGTGLWSEKVYKKYGQGNSCSYGLNLEIYLDADLDMQCVCLHHK